MSKDIFQNLDFERTVLALWLRSPTLREQWATNRSLVYEGLFADSMHRKIYREAASLIEHDLRAFNPKILKHRLKRRLSASTFDVACEVLRKLSRLKGDKEMFPIFKEELSRMEQARKYLTLAIEVKDDLKEGDIDGAKSRVESLLSEAVGESPSVDAGEIWDDLPEHEQYFEDYRNNPERYWGIRTGISLFDKVTGGSRKGLFYIIAAHTKRGKSICLNEVAYTATLAGKFVVSATVEMQKMQAQWRYMSRASGVPEEKIRSPRYLTAKEERIIRDSLQRIKEGGGLLYTAEFRGHNCTVPRLWSMCQAAEKLFDRPIDILCVDHMHDMTPVGRYAAQRSWDAYGEISWDLAAMAKDFRHIGDPPDKPSGMPVWTGNQTKPQSEHKVKLTREDIAYSPLPIQHASYAMYLAANEEDEVIGRLRFGFVHGGRFGGTIDQTYLYPNFEVMLLNDIGMVPTSEVESSAGDWK